MFVRVTTVRQRGTTYFYAQLVKSVRKPGSPHPVTEIVESLGRLSEQQAAAIKLIRDPEAARRIVEDPILEHPQTVEVISNLHYLPIALILDTARRIGLTQLLDELFTDADPTVPDVSVLLSLIAQRCIEPAAKLAIQRWFPKTALSELLAIPLSAFHNTRVHRTLDRLDEVRDRLQDRLPRLLLEGKPSFTTLFVDVTDTWFVGEGPALAQKAKTKEGLFRRKIGLLLLCDEHGRPLRWSVLPGRCADPVAMSVLARAIQKEPWATGAPLVCDRSMGARKTIRMLLELDRPFLTAASSHEFGFYCGKLPLLPIDASTPPEVARAKAAAVGLVDRGDGLMFRDLGAVPLDRVVEEVDSVDPSAATESGTPVPGETPSLASYSELLLRAQQVKDLRDQGWSIPRIATHFSSNRTSIQGSLGLLKLTPKLRNLLMSGTVERVSSTQWRRIAAMPADMQWSAWKVLSKTLATASKINMRRPISGKRPRLIGEDSARPSGRTPKSGPPDPWVPGPKVRAVMSWSHELYEGHRQAAACVEGRIREHVQEINKVLAGTNSRRTSEAILSDVRGILKKDHVLELYSAQLDTTSTDGRPHMKVTLLRSEKEWDDRRRQFGVQILLAHPSMEQTPSELMNLYRAKDRIERDFREIKSVLELRPVHHRTDEKVRAHVTLCNLALLIERTIERTAEKAGRTATAQVIFEDLEDCRLNRLRMGADAEVHYQLTLPQPKQREWLDKLGVAHLIDNKEVTRKLLHR